MVYISSHHKEEIHKIVLYRDRFCKSRQLLFLPNCARSVFSEGKLGTSARAIPRNPSYKSQPQFSIKVYFWRLFTNQIKNTQRDVTVVINSTFTVIPTLPNLSVPSFTSVLFVYVCKILQKATSGCQDFSELILPLYEMSLPTKHFYIDQNLTNRFNARFKTKTTDYKANHKGIGQTGVKQ